MKELKLTEEEAELFKNRRHPRSEAVWIDVRRRAVEIAIKTDEMTEIIDPRGVRLDLVYPSSINP